MIYRKVIAQIIKIVNRRIGASEANLIDKLDHIEHRLDQIDEKLDNIRQGERNLKQTIDTIDQRQKDLYSVVSRIRRQRRRKKY